MCWEFLSDGCTAYYIQAHQTFSATKYPGKVLTCRKTFIYLHFWINVLAWLIPLADLRMQLILTAQKVYISTVWTPPLGWSSSSRKSWSKISKYARVLDSIVLSISYFGYLFIITSLSVKTQILINWSRNSEKSEIIRQPFLSCNFFSLINFVDLTKTAIKYLTQSVLSKLNEIFLRRTFEKKFQRRFFYIVGRALKVS